MATKLNTPKIMAAAYCRVSSKSKDQLESLENQKAFFKDYFEGNQQYELYDIYSDEGITGTTLKRDNFLRMLNDAGFKIITHTEEYFEKSTGRRKIQKDDVVVPTGEKPKFNIILVRNTSRFARTIKVYEVVDKLRDLGVYILFLDLGVSTERDVDANTLRIMQMMDAQFSLDNSRKLLAANEQSRKNKVLRSNSKLFGYTYHPRKKHGDENKLKIKEEEAVVVRTIFRLYNGCFVFDPEAPTTILVCDFDCVNCVHRDASGIGFKSIIKTLRTMGYTRSDGSDWIQTSISRLLSQEKYYGGVNTGKWSHGTVGKKHYPTVREDYEVTIKESIEPIITKALFEQCKQKRLERCDDKGKARVYKGTHTKYKGLLLCGTCRSVYTHNVANNNKDFYNCKNRKQHGVAVCDSTNVFDHQLDSFIAELCSGKINNCIATANMDLMRVHVEQIKNRLTYIYEQETPKKLTELRQQIDLMDNKIDTTLKLIINNSDRMELLEPDLKILERDRTALGNELANLTKKPTLYIDECKSLLETCYAIYNLRINQKTTYTYDEVMGMLDGFTIHGKPNKIGGYHLPPEPRIDVRLKHTTTAAHILDINVPWKVNFLTPSLIYTMGTDDINPQSDVKLILDHLKYEISELESQYS